MKLVACDLKLTSGKPITLFIGAQNVSVVAETKTTTRVEDGTHGNGGWLVEGSYVNTVCYIFNQLQEVTA
jgi:hypothetical protein